MLFFYMESHLEAGSYMDFGMFLQSVMLIALEEGLATCPQAALGEYPDIVKNELGLPKIPFYYVEWHLVMRTPIRPSISTVHREQSSTSSLHFIPKVCRSGAVAAIRSARGAPPTGRFPVNLKSLLSPVLLHYKYAWNTAPRRIARRYPARRGTNAWGLIFPSGESEHRQGTAGLPSGGSN